MDPSIATGRPAPVPAEWAKVEVCTLPTAEQPLRMAGFDALFGQFLRAVEQPAGAATQARLVLAGDADLPGRVQLLANTEAACCSFFTFTLTESAADRAGADAASVALTIEVPATRADVLAALVERARRAAA